VDPARWLVEALLRSDLRGAFRHVYWVGEWPPALPDAPVIAYANHHHHYDGHLGWLLFQERLSRPATLWMAEWDRFPFFGAVGAQPFPPDAPTRRAATLRRTARRFREAPETVLIYYPEGEMRSPDAGIGAFEESALARLARLYPQAHWWPLAVHVTWRGHSRPTAFLTGGSVHDRPERAHERLSRRWQALRRPDPSPRRLLLEGRRTAAEIWRFSFAAPFFSRYLS
jgi:1-acyl-sn-glycerol-3-phosphate acyltransferase